MDYTVHGILQARILEWVAFPFPTQGSNPGLPHCRQILYCLSRLWWRWGWVKGVNNEAQLSSRPGSCFVPLLLGMLALTTPNPCTPAEALFQAWILVTPLVSPAKRK